MIRAALDRLTEAGIPFAPRGPVEPPPGGDVDILVRARDATAAGHVIEAAGWHRFVAAGHPQHAFYLAFDGRWLKLDVNVVPDNWDLQEPYRTPRAGRAKIALLRRLPLRPRRLGPVIALLGPDGSGKGSIISALRGQIPIEVTTVYMGNRAPSRERPAPVRAAVARVPAGPRAAQYRARQALRAAARAWFAHARAWRGDIVLCDRHPLEALALEPDGGGLRGPLGRLVPWPDEIVLLDAPGEILFARKGEHSPEQLDRWRRAYRETFATATLVSTTGELATSVATISEIVWRGLKARRRW